MRQDRRLIELSLDMENLTGVGMARGGLGPMMFTEYQVIDLHKWSLYSQVCFVFEVHKAQFKCNKN